MPAGWRKRKKRWWCVCVKNRSGFHAERELFDAFLEFLNTACCNIICVIVALCLIMLPIWDLRRCSDPSSTKWSQHAGAYHSNIHLRLFLLFCLLHTCFCFHIKTSGFCYPPKIALLFNPPITPLPPPPSPLPSSPSNHLCFYYDRSTVSFIRCFSLHLLPYPPLSFVRAGLGVDLSNAGCTSE